MKRKALDVAKFGGTENLGKATYNNYEHEVSNIETQSKTKLEDDAGHGGAAIIRRFSFGMNAESFKEKPPTKQELFNYHIKGIEIMLWRDGMKIMTEVQPRIMLEEKKMQYHIFVGARPQKGFILREAPQTLKEVARN